MKSLVKYAALAAAIVVGGQASATTVTTSFNAKITIVAACTMTTPADLDFGSTGLITANIDQTTTMNVTCTNTTPYNIGLDKGTNGASVSARLMKHTTLAATVPYSLYSNSGRTTNWGNTIGTDTLAGTGTGSAQTITVYGRVAPQSAPTPGSYTDAVTVTLTY